MEKTTNKFLKTITDNLDHFSYNKIVANLHEIYSFLFNQIKNNYTKNTLIKNYRKILITMVPIIPHFSNECLKLVNCELVEWPKYDKSLLKEEIIKIVIQINGKKRGLINTEPDISEDNLIKLINRDESINKYIEGKNIKKKFTLKTKF